MTTYEFPVILAIKAPTARVARLLRDYLTEPGQWRDMGMPEDIETSWTLNLDEGDGR